MQPMPGPVYPAQLTIDYPDRDLDRLSTALRLIYVLPLVVLLRLVGGGVACAAAAMIVVRRRYPRWLFDFNLQLTRLTARVTAYTALMSDEYPSADDEQSVHLDVDAPGADGQLSRWLPLVKWLLAIPHLVVLTVLTFGGAIAVVGAWFAVLLTGRYPRVLFEYVEGVMRWSLRVSAYAFLLTTDRYPPFTLA